MINTVRPRPLEWVLITSVANALKPWRVREVMSWTQVSCIIKYQIYIKNLEILNHKACYAIPPKFNCQSFKILSRYPLKSWKMQPCLDRQGSMIRRTWFMWKCMMYFRFTFHQLTGKWLPIVFRFVWSNATRWNYSLSTLPLNYVLGNGLTLELLTLPFDFRSFVLNHSSLVVNADCSSSGKIENELDLLQ